LRNVRPNVLEEYVVFKPGKVYRHKGPYSTWDIFVLQIIHTNEDRIKLKFRFITRQGKLVDLEPQKERILIKDLEDWHEVSQGLV
jgi:hypothetical protein